MSKSALSAAERIETSRARVSKIVDRASALIAVHENNAIVTYSKTLAGQIPASYAGHAYNVFQAAMFNYEIVALCSLWDRHDGSFDQQCIPTVRELIDDRSVLDALVEDARGWYYKKGARIYSSGHALEEGEHQGIVETYNKRRGDETARRADAGLQSVLDSIREIERSSTLRSVRNIRDKFLAHGLEQTRAEKHGVVLPMKYGDERLLLEKTLPIVQSLYLWVNGTGFDLDDVRRLQSSYARELWDNCHFSIPGRPRRKSRPSPVVS